MPLINRAASYITSLLFNPANEVTTSECSICQGILSDPVAHDGEGFRHPFCKSCITDCVLEALKNSRLACPLCQTPLQNSLPFMHRFAFKVLIEPREKIQGYYKISKNFLKTIGRAAMKGRVILAGTLIACSYRNGLMTPEETLTATIGSGLLIGAIRSMEIAEEDHVGVEERILESALTVTLYSLGTILTTSMVGTTLWIYDQSTQ